MMMMFMHVTTSYGMDFIHEAYLYHVGRKDNRHNFSVYFLYLYLSFTSPSSLVAALFAFLPQMLVCVGMAYHYDITVINSIRN